MVESYLAPVQLYFSLVPSPPPQSTLSPQEVAEQGMLLLAKQALLAGYDDLYATLRDILHSAPATRSFLPWLDVASLLLTGQGESAQRLHIEVGAPQGAGCETPRREIRDPPTFFYNWFSKLLSK